MLRAIGLLGGTFDPIHIGHLRIAIECRERLGLNEVKLLPAAIPPLKRSPNVGPQQRAAMVELAIAQVPGLTLDTRELQRQGVSYTVETLALIRNEIDADTALVWIMGTDSLEQLDRWHRWQDLLDFVNIAVLQRPGWQGVSHGPVAQWLAQHHCPPGQLCSQPSGGIALLEQPPLAISSTAVRAALHERKNLQFLLPAAVIEYISDNDLYTHQEFAAGVRVMPAADTSQGSIPEGDALIALVRDALDDLKAVDTVDIDVRQVSSVMDYLVVTSGTSTRHVKSLADNVIEKAKAAGVRPIGIEGEVAGEWVLVDFGDVVVHMMQPATRSFYDLERLWTTPPAE